jgi:prevent-host-death family protein
MSAADANRYFSKLLREVQAGETVLVTSRGKPVATIAPASDEAQSMSASRRALMEHLRAQPTLNIPVTWTRDELYDD